MSAGTPAADEDDGPGGPGAVHPLSPALFYATMAAGSVGTAMTAPITALYAIELGASPSQAALIVSCMAVAFLCVDIFGSRVVPRVDARSALVGGYLVFGIGSFASALAPGVAVMSLARVLQGFAAAFPQGAGFHMALRMARRGREAREIGRFNACAFIGLTVGPLMVGAIAGIEGGITGMRHGFAACGVVNVATAVLARFALPSIPPLRRREFGLPSRSVFAGARARWAMVTAGLGFGLRGVCGMTLLPLLGHDIGAGTTGVAVATTFMSVSELGGIVASGRLADRFGRLPVVTVSAALSSAALLLALARPSLVPYLALSAVLGLVLAALRVVPAAMVVDVAASEEAAAVGWRLACDVNSLITAGLVSTVVGLAGVGGGFAYAAVVAGAVGLLTRSIGETRRSVDEATPVPPAPSLAPVATNPPSPTRQ